MALSYSSSFRRRSDEAAAGSNGTSGSVLEGAKAVAGKLGDRLHTKPRTNPLHGDALRKEELQARMAYGRAKRTDSSAWQRATALLAYGQSRAARTRPLRALNLFFFHYGTVMAAGAAYMMFFSLAALLWASFSVAGVIIGGNEELQQDLVHMGEEALPWLLGEGGLVSDPYELIDVGGFSLSLALAMILAMVTSLSWLHGLRSGIRTIWEQPLMAENIVFVKLKDLGLLMVLGLVVLSSAVVSILSSNVIQEVASFFGWGAFAETGMLVSAASSATSFVLDMAIAVLLMRVASRLKMPLTALWQAALIAGLGAMLLRMGSSEVLQNFTNSANPVLSGFGTVLGIFFFFFVFVIVYLFAASWGAVAAADHAERRQVVARAPRH